MFNTCIHRCRIFQSIPIMPTVGLLLIGPDRLRPWSVNRYNPFTNCAIYVVLDVVLIYANIVRRWITLMQLWSYRFGVMLCVTIAKATWPVIAPSSRVMPFPRSAERRQQAAATNEKQTDDCVDGLTSMWIHDLLPVIYDPVWLSFDLRMEYVIV